MIFTYASFYFVLKHTNFEQKGFNISSTLAKFVITFQEGYFNMKHNVHVLYFKCLFHLDTQEKNKSDYVNNCYELPLKIVMNLFNIMNHIICGNLEGMEGGG